MKPKPDDFIDLFDSTSAPEIELAELTLRQHGIPYRVLNKTIVETTNMFLTGGIGARIQVTERDYESALQALNQAGVNAGDIVQPYAWVTKFEHLTAKVPGLHRLSVSVRMIVLFGIMAGLCFVTLYFLTRESAQEIVVKHLWCVEAIVYEGQAIQPESGGFMVISGDKCPETVTFREDGYASFPGIRGRQPGLCIGRWSAVDRDHIKFTSKDTTGIYEGVYAVEAGRNGGIRLVSEKLELDLSVWTFW